MFNGSKLFKKFKKKNFLAVFLLSRARTTLVDVKRDKGLAEKLASTDNNIALSTQSLKELQTSKRVFKVLCQKISV